MSSHESMKKLARKSFQKKRRALQLSFLLTGPRFLISNSRKPPALQTKILIEGVSIGPTCSI